MDCRQTILINNTALWVLINTEADYNYRSQISRKEWLGFWRYEIGIFRKPRGGYRFKWNDKCKAGLKVVNFIFSTKHKALCFLGRHSNYGGKCYHCKKTLSQ